MATFKVYSVVRVRQLLRGEDDAYDDWKLNRRRPHVGDVGAVVEILSSPDKPERYVVECCNQGGSTEWLSDFTADELETA